MPPRIVIHGYKDAAAALEAAAYRRITVSLITPESASSWLGAAYFQALAEKLRPHESSLESLIYDCGGCSGDVVAALRHGVNYIRADKEILTPAVLDLAGRHGAHLISERGACVPFLSLK